MTALTSLLLAAGTRAFRLASQLRGERAVHARGRTFRGTAVLPGGAETGAELLDEPGTYDAVVRFSRSVGLPPWLPDVFGTPPVRSLDALPEQLELALLVAPLHGRWRPNRYDATRAALDFVLRARRPVIPAPAT